MKLSYATPVKLYVFFYFLILTLFSFGQSAPKPCVSVTTNGGFDQQSIGGSGYSIEQSRFVPQWNTTASDDKIEIWSDGYAGVPSYSGIQFAEIEASMNGNLYIDICTPCAGTISWEFAHRGRFGVDECELQVGPPGGPYSALQVASDSNVAWRFYTGTYVVPVGQPVTRLLFVSTAVHNNWWGAGNFLDAVKFTAMPLAANFSSDTVCAKSPTSFTDLSVSMPGGSSISKWEWDFDNDGVADDTNQNPSFAFSTSGTFPVRLTVGTSPSCGNDTIINVDVIDQYTANFIADTICVGLSTTFTDLSTPLGSAGQWEWDFDNDGIVDDNTQHPTFNFSAPGTYPVHLTLPGACAHDTLINVQVTDGFKANFLADTVCLGLPTTFIDLSTPLGSAGQWEWDFDNDGVADSITQNPVHIFPSSGVFPVHLTLPGTCGNDTAIDVYVNERFTANFSADTVCLGLTTSFTDLSTPGGSIAQWQWDFENDGIIDDVSRNPNYVYPAIGTYPVQLTVSGVCGHDTTINVEVKSLPTANFLADTVCAGSVTSFTDLSTPSGLITQWEWDFDNDGVLDDANQNPTFSFSSAGIFPVHLSVVGLCGHDTLIDVMVIDQSKASFSADTVCAGIATNFTDLSTPANSISKWEWDYDNDGVVDDNTQHPTFMFSAVGTYRVHLTLSGSCGHDTLIDVLVNPYPIVDFDAKGEGCDSVCVTPNNNSMISTGTLTYRWDFGDGFLSNLEEPNHCFQNASNSSIEEYDVTLTATSNFGCVTSKTNQQEVTVFPTPLAEFSADPEIAESVKPEISFTDLSVAAAVWNWSFGDGTFSIDANPMHEYSDTGYYNATLGIENVYGCTDTASKTIRIRPDYAIFIPNAFTPDGDGDNEFFRIDGYGIKEVELLIFDRWGSELFFYSGTEFNQAAWDGSYKGEIVKADVYVYKVRITDVFNKKHDYIGRVTVLK